MGEFHFEFEKILNKICEILEQTITTFLTLNASVTKIKHLTPLLKEIILTGRKFAF